VTEVGSWQYSTAHIRAIFIRMRCPGTERMDKSNKPLSFVKPAAPKTWLIAIAGLVWSIVGLMLCRMAYHWLAPLPLSKIAFLGTAGLCLALLAYFVLFAGLARKNIQRIDQYVDRSCIFAFQAWKSYLIIILMISLGVVIRHTPFPRSYLAVIYAAMGGALLLASLHYYGWLWTTARGKTHRQPEEELNGPQRCKSRRASESRRQG